MGKNITVRKHTYFNITQPKIMQDGHGNPRINKFFWSSIQGIKISLFLSPLYLLSAKHFYTYHIAIIITLRWGKIILPMYTSSQTDKIPHLPPDSAHPHNSVFVKTLTKKSHLSRQTDLGRFRTSG